MGTVLVCIVKKIMEIYFPRPYSYSNPYWKMNLVGFCSIKDLYKRKRHLLILTNGMTQMKILSSLHQTRGGKKGWLTRNCLTNI